MIRAIVHRRGSRPDHDDPQRRVPDVLLVDCPGYAGEPFFDVVRFPNRKQWVPIFPRRAAREDDSSLARTQLPVILAWALTPWKAQGMSLDKVMAQLGKAASRPGVAFVALTCVRRPDGLALDDDFPVFSVFQKQKRRETFQKRTHWEKWAWAAFACTVRRFMRKGNRYTDESL